MNRFGMRALSLLVVIYAALGAASRSTAGDDLSMRASLLASSRSSRAVANAPEGMSCTLVDFEGLGNQQPIPNIDGISSAGWVAVIDSDAGGSGDTAFEPSGETWADWPGGVFGEGRFTYINFDPPASHVSIYYASAVTTLLSSWDADNDLLHATIGQPNYDQGPGGDPTGHYNKWDQLAVDGVHNNDIARVKVSGAWGQTAIDDLLVCRRVSLAAAEFTQAIQQLQTIDELKADLLGDGQPPVPIIAHKPAALRLYFDEVLVPTKVTAEANLDGFVQTRSVMLMPGCTVDDARRGTAGCPSADFYFKPQNGSWPATIRVKTEGGSVIEEHSLMLTSRLAKPIVLGAVRVCDAKDEGGKWLCENDYIRRLNELVPFLRKVAPTHHVRAVDTYHSFEKVMDDDGDGEIDGEEAGVWWGVLANRISLTRSLFDEYYDFYGIPERLYYGMARPQAVRVFGGMAAGIPSRAALSASFVPALDEDASAPTVAHEVFHMLGRKHTAKLFPPFTTTRGCWDSTADDPDWPFTDNELRTGDLFGSIIEVGFDVAERKPLPWNATYEIMGYCTPQWISAFTYTKVLEEALDASVMMLEPAATTQAGLFWQVAGTIDGETELASFDPLFEVDTIGPTDQGAGSLHYILVRDDADAVLFVRYFDVEQPQGMALPGVEEPVLDVAFSELVPVQPSAAKIEVYEWTGMLLGTLELSGDAPDVQITSPAGGGLLTGEQTIAWSVTDPDSDEHAAWVQFSTDPEGVDTWRTLARGITDDELTVDFDEFEGGSDGAVVRVLVSDGANTGTDTTDPFEVAPHLPEAYVLFPADQSVFREGDLVWLQGTGHDADDGALEDEALVWTSDLDGVLGTGEEVQTTALSVGTHEITLAATDSDANEAPATIHVVVAGAGPTVTADVEALDTLPTTCVAVTLDAEAGSVPLETFEYSLDNGETWTDVLPAELPHEFVVPGSGGFHLVARAFDVSGQTDVVDRSFFTDAPCLPVTTTTLPTAMCGDPNGDEQIKASDALLALRAAVDSYECEICVCDANGSASIEASDALRILRKSVGHAVELVCPDC